MPTQEYQEAFEELRIAIENRDILEDPEDFRQLIQQNMQSELDAPGVTDRERYQSARELAQLMQPLKKMDTIGDDAVGDDVIEPVASALASLTLFQFNKVAHTISVDQLSSVLADMQKIAFYIKDDSNFIRFSETLATIQTRAPDLARISDDTHCVWFTGKSSAGKIKDISLEDLMHVAQHVHLYPDAETTILTDDPISVGKQIDEQNISALKKVKIRHWQELFNLDWPDEFPKEKKEILKAAIENEANGVVRTRYPASGKDMLLMIAITLKGGKGVDVDVNCTAPIKIFDPFGFRCYAYIGEHRLHISPAFIAATKNSKVAWKIVEQIADTWKEQRETASEPGQLNTIESQRVKINSVLEISYEPLLVMQKEYGPRFDRLFTSPADSLVLSITTDVINLPSSRLLDGPPEAPSLRRRASTPGMAAGRVGFEVIFGSSAHTLIDTLPASSALKRKYESEGFDVSEYQNRKFSSVSSEVTNLIKDKIAKNNLSIVWADCGAKMKDVTPVGYLDDSRETIILVRYPANADDSKSQRASVTLVPRKLLTSIESEETDKLIEENKSHLAKPSKMIKTTITFKTIQQLDSGEEPVKKMKKTKEVEAPIASSSKRKR